MSDDLDDAPIVTIRGLTKRFDSFTAVREVDLEVARGEILALVGQNGAGKTTTIRMLMGILAPSEGSARIDGFDCFAERPKVMERVGYLPDEPWFSDHLRGGEIARFCGEMRGMEREVIVARAHDLAVRLQIEDALDDYAVNYSMGMRKKLALLCAMLHQPRLLILDEPTNGLDPLATQALLSLVREQVAAGCAVFYSTHLLHQAERLCHRVAIMAEGRIAALGTPTGLRDELAPGGTLEDVFFRVVGRIDAAPPS